MTILFIAFTLLAFKARSFNTKLSLLDFAGHIRKHLMIFAFWVIYIGMTSY